MNINNNRTVSLPEHFLHCLPMNAGNTSGDLFVQGGGMEMSVLERQRAALKLQQQQLHLLLQQQQQQEGEGEGERKGGFGQGAYSNNVFPFSPSFSPLDGAQFYGGNLVICGSGDNSQPNGISALTRPIKADPGVESVCPEFGGFVGAGDRRSTGVTASCNNNSGTACQPPVVDKESSKKRKAKEKTLHHPPKVLYVCLFLQDLVPGCNKITGKAGMLDEIINYVQSLQRQVEFLSMKLAAVNPGLEFNIDDFFAKEVFAACSSNYPTTMGLSSPDMAATNSAYDLQQFNNNPTQQHQIGQQICGGFDIGGMNEVVLDMGLRRTISAPVSLPPDNLLDSSCLTQQIESCMPWDNADLQSMYAMDFQ